jgi:hypothetical protein
MNIGQKLVELSGLSLRSALDHLLGITKSSAGTSTGLPVTVIPKYAGIYVPAISSYVPIGSVPTSVDTAITPTLEDTPLDILADIKPAKENIAVVVTGCSM